MAFHLMRDLSPARYVQPQTKSQEDGSVAGAGRTREGSFVITLQRQALASPEAIADDHSLLLYACSPASLPGSTRPKGCFYLDITRRIDAGITSNGWATTGVSSKSEGDEETKPLVTLAMSGSIRTLGLHPTVDNGPLFLSTGGLAPNLSAFGLLHQERI